jgi:Protein of unknown function (DUF3570)
MRKTRTLAGGAVVAAAFSLFLVRSVGAENRMAVRGTYFREASTRVVQPMIEAQAELPNGYNIGGHAAVDAISSASIAQGAATDEVFHENRYEISVNGGKKFGDLHVGAYLRYSYEEDYRAHSAGIFFTREFWDRTGAITATLARAHDDIEPFPPLTPRDLDVWFFGTAYSQILSPTTLAQVGYELFHAKGFLGNPYISHPDLGRENLPQTRVRHALTAKIAQYFPYPSLGLQLHYRFYFDQGAFGTNDPWGLTAHTIETRAYKSLGRDFELRLSYRFHWQGSAAFWCNARPDNGGMLGCYGMRPRFHSWDVKFGNLTSHLPEVKLTWELRGLAHLPGFRWLSRGSVDVAYGYYFESTPYGQVFTDRNAPPVINWPFTYDHGGAHIIQTGYALPF